MTATNFQTISVPVQRLPHARDLPLPAYATAGSAGLDLTAAVDAELTLPPLGRAKVPTGICIGLVAGFEAQVRPRSGLALNHGVTVLNTPGTIDADYRGEICVILINLGDASFVVTRGMRVAQLVFAPVLQAELQECASLDATPRGSAGFGSTGLAASAATLPKNAGS